MKNPEIVLNLWYLIDTTGTIFLLKAKSYVAEGTDEQKLKFLNSRALLDYMVAKDYRLRSGFKLILGNEEYNATNKLTLEMEGEISLFGHVIDEIEKELSKLCPLTISQSPLVCITPLHFTDDLKVVPIENMKRGKL